MALPTWCKDEIIVRVFPGMEWLPRESHNISSRNGGEASQDLPTPVFWPGGIPCTVYSRGHRELDMTERVSRTPVFHMQCGRLSSCARQRLDLSSSRHPPQMCASVTSLQESRVNVASNLGK